MREEWPSRRSAEGRKKDRARPGGMEASPRGPSTPTRSADREQRDENVVFVAYPQHHHDVSAHM